MADLKKLRIEKNLSQQALAAKVGISQQAINRFESGEIKPKIETAQKIAPILGIDWWELYDQTAN